MAKLTAEGIRALAQYLLENPESLLIPLLEKGDKPRARVHGEELCTRDARKEIEWLKAELLDCKRRLEDSLNGGLRLHFKNVDLLRENRKLKIRLDAAQRRITAMENPSQT